MATKKKKDHARKPAGQLIGVATIDITPPIGVKLAGYGSRKDPSVGVGHRLRAEALACEGTDGGWVLVTSDVIGYPRQCVLSVREKAQKKTGVPGAAMLISGTHTHSGPVVRQIYQETEEAPPLDRNYCNELEEKLVCLIADAWKARKEGFFEAAWTEAPELGSNRRVQLPDGSWVNEWQDFEGKHTGYFDPSVLLVGVRRPDGSRDCLFVNYGCHPVTLGPRNLRISADYPGYLKDILEARGVCRTAMFGLAGGGNINPRVCIMVGPEYPRRMGESLAEKVLGAVPNLSPVFPGKVRAGASEWKFVSTRRRKGQRPWEKEEREVSSELQALRAGDLIFLGVPGELFSEYVAMFRDASPVPVTAVVSLANDSVGYLPVDGAVPQGGHEVTFAACHYIQNALVEHAKKAMSATE